MMMIERNPQFSTFFNCITEQLFNILNINIFSFWMALSLFFIFVYFLNTG